MTGNFQLNKYLWKNFFAIEPHEICLKCPKNIISKWCWKYEQISSIFKLMRIIWKSFRQTFESLYRSNEIVNVMKWLTREKKPFVWISWDSNNAVFIVSVDSIACKIGCGLFGCHIESALSNESARSKNDFKPTAFSLSCIWCDHNSHWKFHNNNNDGKRGAKRVQVDRI